MRAESYVLKAIILDHDPGDITTIEDEGSVEVAQQARTQMIVLTIFRFKLFRKED